jgi:rsbT co-antagonist protein RsbR
MEKWGESKATTYINPGYLSEVYELTEEDLRRIAAFKPVVMDRMDEMIEEWYGWLKGMPEFEQFFSDEDTLRRVQQLQHGYWDAFMDGVLDQEYVDKRHLVGEAHARIGLPLNTYFAGMSRFMTLFERAMISAEMDPDDRLATTSAISKLLHVDTAIVVDTYNHIVEDTLTAQAKSLMEMSTPVTQIWSGILLLPIVGIIDSARARDIMNATLAKIGETQARIFILDISGVGVVDTAVANNLIKITRATRLMGCESTISGVSPAIAQTIVDLGIEVGRIKTTATMKDALADAFARVGMQITTAG